VQIPVLVAEPNPDALDVVEKLCKEYNIKVAIHEHKKPNQYWDPAFVLAAIKDRGPLLGACADGRALGPFRFGPGRVL